ncbi:hypothetical protein [Levilactobacillus mulengensis]|uniref:hypothetical protein n=1 Tax=Levilactobacillus mulengensis TaxID=2486025 RepID=UPI000F79CF93|nr:hypothetical protein [Levilactobacillus mulengensis]
MHFHKLFMDQVAQTVDLFEIFLFLLIPVFLVKGAVDLVTLGELFWVDYGRFFLEAIVGFIILFAVIDLIEAGLRYFHRE